MPIHNEITKRGKHKQMILIFKKSNMVNLNPTIKIITVNGDSLNMLFKTG